MATRRPNIRTIQCYADQATQDKLKFIAQHNRRTMSDMVRELIRIEYDRLRSNTLKPNLIGE